MTVMAVQRRALQTRQKILDAAAEEFALHGYVGATMAAIQERAGLTKGAVYFHFTSKAELARAIFCIDDQRAALAGARLGSGAMQAAVDISHEYAEALANDSVTRAAVRLAIEQGTFEDPTMTTYPTWIKATTELFVQAADAGELLPRVDPADTARTVVAAFVGTHILSQVLTRRQDLHKRVAELWRLLLPALMPQALAETIVLTGTGVPSAPPAADLALRPGVTDP
jgi:AcrR family transcriptional regulator